MDEEVIAQAARDWLARQLAGVDLAKMFDPVQDTITHGAADLEDAMHQLIRLVAVTAAAGLAKRPEAGAPPAESGAASVLSGVIGLFSGKLLAVLAPLGSFATVLGQSTSGLSLFLGAVNILAATLAPVLMPAFVILSAALLALSAILLEEIKPGLGEFYTQVVGSAIPAIRTFTERMVEAYGAVRQFIDNLSPEKLKENVGKIGQNVQEEGPGFLGRLLKLFGAGETEDERVKKQLLEAEPEARKARDIAAKFGGANAPGNERQVVAGGGEFGPEPPKPDFTARFMKEFMRGLEDTVKMFQMQVGSKASVTGIVQASREAQLKAVGMDPFQQRMLQVSDGVLKALWQMVASLRKPEPPFIGV